MRKLQLYFTLSTHILLLGGCGEVESIVLPQRPPRDQFEAVQKTLLKLGCSADGTGCHSVLVGEFKVEPLPKSPSVFDTEFTLTKAFIDLEEPKNSALMRSSLRGDPLSLGHPICFDSFEACGFRRIEAWVAFGEGSMLTPDEACPLAEVVENACFNR